MKKTLYCAVFALAMAALALPAGCSDEETAPAIETPQPEEDKDEEQGGGGMIPQDVLNKAAAIYDAASIDPQTVTSVHQLAILTSICATRDDDGPISVTSATLNGEQITLMTLGGTEDRAGQATTMEENQLASFGKDNDYLKAVRRLFADGTIPADHPVLIAGVSLGGMIAQQVLGEKDVLDRFRIAAVVTFGSPITLPLDRKGVRVVRFADVNDRVPSLGEIIIRSGMVTKDLTKEELLAKLDELDASEKISATSKYTEMIETHALSYIEDPCWDIYDFMGDKAGTNKLILKERMRFYEAPKAQK